MRVTGPAANVSDRLPVQTLPPSQGLTPRRAAQGCGGEVVPTPTTADADSDGVDDAGSPVPKQPAHTSDAARETDAVWVMAPPLAPRAVQEEDPTDRRGFPRRGRRDDASASTAVAAGPT